MNVLDGLSDLQAGICHCILLVIHCGFRYFCAALQRNLPVLYQEKHRVMVMGQQRTDRQERAQTVVKDAVQKEAQANADVPAGKYRGPFRRAVCRKK